MSMRIETIETVKNIIDKQRMDTSSPKFVSGEIFSAEVAEKTGDFVLLRRMDGWAFLARVMRDMGMKSGDRVEVIVKDAAAGKQVLQVLDIDKGDSEQYSQDRQNVQTGNQMLGSAQAKDPNVRSQLLMNTMAMLKQNASMSPKMATFLAQNSISPTPENTAELAQMASGVETVQSLLLNLIELQPLTDQENTAQASQTVQAQTVQPQGQGKVPVPGNPQMQPAHKGEVMQTSMQDTSETAKAGAQQAVPLRNEAVQANVQQTTVPENNVQGQGMQQQMSLDTVIAQQIRAMFTKLSKDEKDGAEIKKDVKALPAKLKALMTMLTKTQNKNKEAMGQKADALERQFSLMAEAKRFFCLQLPFVMPDETRRNAELFVYKHGGRSNALDAENIVILLGLDTQHIGRVETLITVSGKSVSLLFYMDDPALFADVKVSEKQLGEAIEKAGYRLSDIRVEKLEQRTTVLNAESVLAGHATGSGAELDIRI